MKQKLYICSFGLLFFLITAGYSFPNAQAGQPSKVKISAKELKEPAELKKRLNTSEKERASLKEGLNALEKEKAELKNKINALETERAIFKSQLYALEKGKSGLKNRLNALEKENAVFRDKVSALVRENQLLGIQMDILSARLQIYKAGAASHGKLPSVPEITVAKKLSHYNLAYLYFLKGSLDEALGEYREVLKYDPHDLDTHYNLGCLYAWKGSFKEAVREFEAVLSLDPGDKETYYNLASIYRKDLKDKKLAEEYYRKFLEDGPKN